MLAAIEKLSGDMQSVSERLAIVEKSANGSQASASQEEAETVTKSKGLQIV